MEIYKKIWQRIEESKKIVLITHKNPDGDTLGSALAMQKMLQKMGKKSSVVNYSSSLPKRYDFLYGFSKIKKEMPINCDLAIFFDCSNYLRATDSLPNVYIINIDHHQSNDEFGDINLVDQNAPSTTSVVYKLLLECGVKLDSDISTALYCGLYSDSGGFSYDRVDEETFNIASLMVKDGASPSRVAKNLNSREPLCRVRLLSLALSTLELSCNAKVASMYISQDMLKQCGADEDDSEDFISHALSLHSVEAAIFARERVDGCRISLRTKSKDANKILSTLGGGGHGKAAGVVLSEKIGVAIKKVTEAVCKDLDE